MTIAVEQLNEAGVVVVNVTCDNPTTNWSMLQGLGASLRASNLNVKLKLYNTLGLPIYAIPDAVHCLKLARNAFGDYLDFEDEDGQKISWTYIIELNKLQEEKGLFLANRLRKEHVRWQSNKMNVRIAAQTISNSVADAIDYCRDTLKLSQFEKSEGTTKFLRIFDKLFDILNSKTKFGKGFKAPLKKDNFSDRCEFFDMCYSYICNLKVLNGKKLVEGPRKAAFIGFLAGIESFKRIFNDYVQSGLMHYILTYKYSQDHLGLINFANVKK